jgi:superfamily I DNA and/or RNA helicase
MDCERAIAFRAQTKCLAKITINRAEIIVCTLATAATPIVANGYGFAEGLIIDEAACVAEPMIWPIMDKYTTLNWRILVGDLYQLPEQTRALPELASVYNKVIYQNRLTHTPSTALEQRPIVQAIRRFNLAHFNQESNVVYFSINDSQAQVVVHEYLIPLMEFARLQAIHLDVVQKRTTASLIGKGTRGILPVKCPCDPLAIYNY